jgi:uncharacterized protein (TIGR03067 family)
MKMILKRALGSTVLSLLMPCFLLCLPVGCKTNPPTAAALQRLQGTWEGVLVGQEKDGKITINITGNSLHFHRDTNFWYETTFTLPAGTHPQQLHATIKDGPDKDSTGKVVRAIFKTGDGNFTLAINQDPAQEPPKSFGDDTPGVIRYEFWRVQPQNKNVAASTSGETGQPQQITGNAKVLEQGRKHPAEMANIASGPDLFGAPIAFQNNSAGIRKVYWIDKNGERQPYCELKPGENCGIGTYLSHPWVVTDADGNALGLYYPDGQKRTVTLE